MAAVFFLLLMFGFFALMGWLAWLDHLSDQEREQNRVKRQHGGWL